MTSATSSIIAAGPPINRSTKCVMLVGGVLSAIALIGVTAVLPQIEADLARDATDKLLVKLLGPIIGVTMVVGAPLTGFLIDRIGARRIQIVACLTYAFAGTSGLYLASLHALLAARLLVGFAAAAIVIVSMTLINRAFEGVERAKWMGFHISTAMVCTLAIHPTLGLLGELGWRWPFLIYIVGLPIALVALGMPKDRPEPRIGSGSAAAKPRQAGWPLAWFPLRYIPLALIIGGIVYMPTVYFPFVVRQFGVTSPAIISFILLADSAIGTIMAYFYGYSQRSLSTRTAFLLSFSFTGLGMLIVSVSSSLVGLIAGMLVYGLGIGWFTPNLMTAVSHHVTQDEQARATGIIKAAHFLSAPVAILAVEPITRVTGPMGSIWAGAGLSALAVLLLVLRMSGGAFDNRMHRRDARAAYEGPKA
jgi:MFS family permease